MAKDRSLNVDTNDEIRKYYVGSNDPNWAGLTEEMYGNYDDYIQTDPTLYWKAVQGNRRNKSDSALLTADSYLSSFLRNKDDSSGQNSPYGGIIYSGGGGWGSAAAKSPEDIQKETQQQINNLGDIYGNRGKALTEGFQDQYKNLEDQIKANNALKVTMLNNAQRYTDWQPNEQHKQSLLRGMRDRMGNAANGSAIVDLREGLGRLEDMLDVELINTINQNSNAAYNNWFQANAGLVSDWNELAPEIRDTFSQMESQYRSALSNFAPELASNENYEKSKSGEKVTVGEGTDEYELPAGVNFDIPEALKANFGKQKIGSAVNPETRGYWRPDKAVNEAKKIQNTGSADQAKAANEAFLDNLNAFRWRV